VGGEGGRGGEPSSRLAIAHSHYCTVRTILVQCKQSSAINLPRRIGLKAVRGGEVEWGLRYSLCFVCSLKARPPVASHSGKVSLQYSTYSIPYSYHPKMIFQKASDAQSLILTLTQTQTQNPLACSNLGTSAHAGTHTSGILSLPEPRVQLTPVRS